MTRTDARFRIAAVRSPLATLSLSQAAAAQEVNLYTTREPGLIQPLDGFVHEVHRHQGQQHLHQGRPGRARGGRRPPVARRCADDRRHRRADRSGRKGADAAGAVGRARARRAGQPARERRASGSRSPCARASCTCEGSEPVDVHLRAAGRSRVEGQGLHARRPASLQHGARSPPTSRIMARPRRRPG